MIEALFKLISAGIIFAFVRALQLVTLRAAMAKTKKAEPTRRDDRRAKVAAQTKAERKARK